MLQWLCTDVASFCFQCSICFFFKTYVASVFIWVLHMFHTYVISVLSGCCVCFTIFFKCFSCVFANVSDACFKCFICLKTYIAFGCFKSRSGVASSSSLFAALPRCLLLLLPAPAGIRRPLPLFSMLVMFGGGTSPAWAWETVVSAGVWTPRPSGC